MWHETYLANGFLNNLRTDQLFLDCVKLGLIYKKSVCIYVYKEREKSEFK